MQFDPRNDSGDEIPGWPRGHNTPALTANSDESTQLVVVR